MVPRYFLALNSSSICVPARTASIVSNRPMMLMDSSFVEKVKEHALRCRDSRIGEHVGGVV